MTDQTAPDTEPTDPRMAAIELRHLRAEVARLRAFVAMADGASHAAEYWEGETKRWLAFIERGMETHMRFGVIREDGTREELPCADWCYACRIEKAEVAINRVRHLTDDGPPAGTGIGGEWEGGWDSAMEAVRAALTPKEVEQKTVLCHCTCPDCWHGCCHIPLWDLTDDDLDELYRRRDLAEAAVARVRARAEQWQAAMGRGEVNPAARQVLDLLDEPPRPGATEATPPAREVDEPQRADAAPNRLRKDLVAALADYPIAAWTPDNLAGRVLRVMQPELDRLSATEAAIERVHELHRKASDGDTCVYCAPGQRLGYDTTWPCDTIRALDGPAPDPAVTESTESPLRDQMIAVVRPLLPEDLRPQVAALTAQEITDALLAAILPATRITATLARDSEATVQRVIGLYERWTLAGPPLGKSMTGYFQWWREHLAELHAAILPPANQTQEK